MRSFGKGASFMPSSCSTCVREVREGGSSKAMGDRSLRSLANRHAGATSRVLFATGMKASLDSCFLCAALMPCTKLKLHWSLLLHKARNVVWRKY